MNLLKIFENFSKCLNKWCFSSKSTHCLLNAKIIFFAISLRNFLKIFENSQASEGIHPRIRYEADPLKCPEPKSWGRRVCVIKHSNKTRCMAFTKQVHT